MQALWGQSLEDGQMIDAYREKQRFCPCGGSVWGQSPTLVSQMAEFVSMLLYHWSVLASYYTISGCVSLIR